MATSNPRCTIREMIQVYGSVRLMVWSILSDDYKSLHGIRPRWMARLRLVDMWEAHKRVCEELQEKIEEDQNTRQRIMDSYGWDNNNYERDFFENYEEWVKFDETRYTELERVQEDLEGRRIRMDDISV